MSNPVSSAHAKLAEGLVSTGMVKAAVLAECPGYEQVLRDTLPQLLLADEWYEGASQVDIVARGKVLDAIFNRKDPLWCYPTPGEFAVLWDIVQFIVGSIDNVSDQSNEEGWSHSFIPGAVPRTRELQWLGNRPFRCRGWDGAAQTQREFEQKSKRKPYSIHSPQQVGLLQADIAGAADDCGRLPFEELHQEYESLARQIDKAVQLHQALYVKRTEPKDLRTTPPDYMIERMLEEVGIQVGPPKKKFYANAFFNELQCGDHKNLAYAAQCLVKEFATMGDDCESLGPQGNPAFCYRLCIDKCVWILYDWHFGFRGALRPREVATKGVEMALKYFRIVANDLAKVTASTDSMDAAWFEPYSEAILLATLSGCTRQRTLLSDYLHPRLTAEMTSPRTDAAFQAMENGDRGKFAAALSQSTANFAKTASDDRPRAAVALLESVLAALAHERGWTDLSFDLPIAARLVTHQSLEMG